MRCCPVSSDWHVYHCLDGIPKNTLDGTLCWTDGQLLFPLSPILSNISHSLLKLFMSGVMVIYQVTFLYLADWYVPPNLAGIVFLNRCQPATIHMHLLLKLGRVYLVRHPQSMHSTYFIFPSLKNRSIFSNHKETRWPCYSRSLHNPCLTR